MGPQYWARHPGPVSEQFACAFTRQSAAADHAALVRCVACAKSCTITGGASHWGKPVIWKDRVSLSYPCGLGTHCLPSKFADQVKRCAKRDDILEKKQAQEVHVSHKRNSRNRNGRAWSGYEH